MMGRSVEVKKDSVKVLNNATNCISYAVICFLLHTEYIAKEEPTVNCNAIAVTYEPHKLTDGELEDPTTK